MSSGLEQPARSTESTKAASIPFETSYLQSPKENTSSRTEPPILDFSAPIKTLNSSPKAFDVAQTRTPEVQQERLAPPEQKPFVPIWDPARPGWDQPLLRRREQTQPQTGDQRRPAHPAERPIILPGERPAAPSDRQSEPERPIVRHAQTYNLSDRLDHRTMGRIPDAKIFVNPNFDPSKPVNVIVYNHGWNDTIGSAFKNARLQEQMAQAPPNSILVVPSWQIVDGAANGLSNDKFKTGFIGALDATMRLNGRTLNDIADITIVSHSAGRHAVSHELNQLRTSPLYDKVTTLASLDMQYETKQAVEDWIAHNVRNGKFANGKAAFVNLWTSETAGLSQVQAQKTAELVHNNPNLISIDYGSRVRGTLSPSELARTPIVFANTRDGHMNVPIRFFGHSISKLQGQHR